MTAIFMSIVVFHTLASLVLLLASAGENALSVRRLFVQRHDHRGNAQHQTAAGRSNALQLRQEQPDPVARAA